MLDDDYRRERNYGTAAAPATARHCSTLLDTARHCSVLLHHRTDRSEIRPSDSPDE
jgi:hypothetical protein